MEIIPEDRESFSRGGHLHGGLDRLHFPVPPDGNVAGHIENPIPHPSQHSNSTSDPHLMYQQSQWSQSPVNNSNNRLISPGGVSSKTTVATSSSNQRSEMMLRPSVGPAYPSVSAPGLGLPMYISNQSYRSPINQQQYLTPSNLHSLPAPQPQPLGKFGITEWPKVLVLQYVWTVFHH